MSMPMFGHMEPFVVGEKFVEYVSRLEQFFLVNEVPDNKKVPMLVTMAGPSLYSIASRICSPEDPCTKSYEQLIALLKKHLAPTVNVVAERYKFQKFV
ncbi:AAEL007140-PA [Aedes aegypti]|uniref:AAEL007140-PA n=1 Tax=Aedes aegypti TaxID=7159 RepID=Q173K0_AEDAE|nr:AAEL007140-PA [Aedes aegypti]